MIWGLALAVAAATPVASDPDYDHYLTPGTMVEIAPGRHVNLRCEGKSDGGPTIILEAGLGFPSLSWRDTQPRLAQLARSCAYDRAGLGFSSPGPMPRSAAAIVDDLELLIAHSGLKPPFILVGNSMGGQVVRLFAFRHPDQVAGLLLLDPYVEGQFRTFATIDTRIGSELAEIEAGEVACVEALRRGTLSAEEAERRDCIARPNSSFSSALNRLLQAQRLTPGHYEAVRSESQMLDSRNEAELRAARRPLAMPIVILSASRNFAGARFDPSRAKLLAAQAKLHASLAGLSPRGEVRTIDAEHVIQVSAPDAVVTAVSDILQRIEP